MTATKKFILKYMDGREEHYENYRYYGRLSGNEKIYRNGNKLYKAGKVFLKEKDDYWVETNIITDKRREFTLEFKDGSTKNFVGYSHYARLNDENKITRSNGRVYYQGKVFEQVVKDYWVEIERDTKRKSITLGTDCEENHRVEKQLKRESGPAKFKLVFANGEVKEFENYKKCSEREDSEKIVLGTGKKSLTYHGYRFVRDTIDRHTWKQDTTRFNKNYDTFYLTKDWNVWEFENMQSYFNRDDSEHMKLTRVDRRIKCNGKSKKVTRCITYKGARYYNIDNWKTWVAMNPVKYKKEKLNHSNKIPITKFYKEGVWYFTPDKKTNNYRHFLNANEIYVFSNKYAFWSGALWEKDSNDNVWYYRKEMLKGDKVGKFIIPLKEDEYYFKAEIKQLRKMGYRINYRYVKCKRQQPNKRNKEQQEEFMKKVKKMSRADRKKALNKKKKRQGKYKEKRGM